MTDTRVQLTGVLRREEGRILFRGVRSDGEHVALHIGGDGAHRVAQQIEQHGECIVYVNDSGQMRYETTTHPHPKTGRWN